jgi:hypothetical protein
VPVTLQHPGDDQGSNGAKLRGEAWFEDFSFSGCSYRTVSQVELGQSSIPEFQTRLGVDRGQAERLFRVTRSILAQTPP